MSDRPRRLALASDVVPEADPSAPKRIPPPHECAHCHCINQHVVVAFAQAQDDLANLERELRAKRAQIKRLREDQHRMMLVDPHYEDAMGVLEHWKARCHPKARELSGKRLELVLARLHGSYTREQLEDCVEGYAEFPFIVNRRRSRSGQKDDWWADAELIFRDAKHVDEGIRLSEMARMQSSPIPRLGEPDAVHKPAQNPTSSILGTFALRIVEMKGWPVLPVKPRQKVPASRNGLLDATLDPVKIERAWERWPDLNIGIRTGRESGVVVLDVDGDLGSGSLRSLERTHGELPCTLSVKTPSGGSHFYFQHPGRELRNSAGMIAPGIDFRGDGGYVLCPPSRTETGVYEVDERVEVAPLPVWLLTALTARQEAQERRARYSPDERAEFIERGAPDGTRNDRMAKHVGWLIRKHGDQPPVVRSLAHVWNDARLKPPLSPTEVDRVIDSIWRSEARNDR